MPKGNCTAAEIVDAVQRHYETTSDLRQRMEDDYVQFWLLTEHPVDEGTVSFTTNESRAYAQKLMGFISSSKAVVTIPPGTSARNDRDVHSLQERFARAALRAIDEDLKLQLHPPLKDSLAFYACARGSCFGRAMLTKDKDGSTQVDVMPWDPLHTYWSMGRRGPTWMAYKINKTQADIASEYPDFEWPDGVEDTDEFEIIDYVDDEHNYIVMNNPRARESEAEFLRDPAEHGSSRIPVFYSGNPIAPHIQPLNGGRVGDVTMQDSAKDWGESVWATNRFKYESINDTWSDLKTLVRRIKNPVYVLTSRDGTRVLEENPFASDGSVEIPLKEGERIQVLDFLKMPQDANSLLAFEASEVQRGGRPYVAYGEAPFALSGFAINSLKQSIGTPLSPPQIIVTTALEQIVRLITEQYGSGKFKAMQLVGQDARNQWFVEEFDPEDMQDARIMVTLAPDLPQDQMASIQMAQIARDPGAGGVPMLDDNYVLEHILQVEDPDMQRDAVKAQLAERTSQIAVIFTLMEAAAKRGEEQIAQIYLGELQQMMMQRMQAMAQQQGPQGPQGPMPPNGAGPPPQNINPSPNVMPPQAAGAPQPPPTPQAGPNVPPGTPRPGAVSDAERRAALNIQE